MPCLSPGAHMQRRDFITLLGGAVASPLAARAQESERKRRIGVLMPGTADDAEYQARMAAFLQGLQQLGWSDGRNVRIDTRWAAGDANLIRKYAAELIALTPDVILAPGTTSLGPLLQATRTIVFTTLLDPVGAGFVDSLARPGGNATGFIAFEYGLSGKWLELLKRAKPDARGDPSGSSHSRRDRAVCRNPVRGAVVRSGVAAD
jgi:putative ABC transport system substrate-binding protein